MQIENPDALKSWLTHILEPLCDADPAALARYVLALLKKDKAVRELSQCMSEQLDVFLGPETAPFLARLFDSIATEEYLRHPVAAASVSGATGDAAAEVGSATSVAAIAPSANSSTGSLSQPPTISGDHQAVASSNSSTITSAAASASSSSLALLADSASLALGAGEFAGHPGELAVPNHHDLLIEHASPLNSPVRSPTKPPTAINSSSTTSSSSAANHQHHHHQTKNSSSAAAASSQSNSSSSRNRRISARSRSRSRSRSFERSRGGGGHRGTGGDKSSGTNSSRSYGRNKSPASGSRSGGGGGGGGYDRRGNNQRSWKSRSRSPLESGALRRGGAGVSKSQRRGSSSPFYGGSADINGSADLALTTSTKQQPPLPPTPTTAVASATSQRQRCRDFDEKGYCMRGETCQWDHGVDPVVLEDISNPALMAAAVPHGRGGEYNPDAPDLWTRSSSAAVQYGRGNPGAAGAGGGNPAAAGMQHRGGYARSGAGAVGGGTNAFRLGGGGVNAAVAYPFAALGGAGASCAPLQRELISVPVLEAGGGGVGQGLGGHGGDISGPNQPKRRYDPEDTVAVAEGGSGPAHHLHHHQQHHQQQQQHHQGGGPPAKRKMPIAGRLGPRLGGPSMQQNCSLELRKVPRGLNSIAHLNNHFSKFGKIVNIQISYDGDAEAAIVTFSTHAEANVAYRSTEAVLNNRFIKVFWHSAASGGTADGLKASAGGEEQAGGGQAQGHLRHHKGGANQYSLNNTLAAAAGGGGNNNGTSGSAAAANNGHSQVPAVPNAAAATDPAVAAAKTSASAPTPSTETPATALAERQEAVRRARLNRLNPAAAANTRRAQDAQTKAQLVQLQKLVESKRELLDRYLKQIRTNLDMLQKQPQTAVAERTRLMQQIQATQAEIDKLTKAMAVDQVRMQEMQAEMQLQQLKAQKQQHGGQQQQQQLGAGAKVVAVRRTREQQKKELLDIELELIAQQQEGNDCAYLYKRMEELQREMPAAGGVAGAGGKLVGVVTGQQQQQHQHQHHIKQHHQHQQQLHHPLQRGVGGGGQRVRPAPPGSTSVDRRPTTLRVLGFDAEDSDVLLGHFKHFGEVTRNELDKPAGGAPAALVIAFATRINAEQAMLRGRTFKDKQLQITWVSNPCVAPTTTITTKTTAATAAAIPLNQATNRTRQAAADPASAPAKTVAMVPVPSATAAAVVDLDADLDAAAKQLLEEDEEAATDSDAAVVVSAAADSVFNIGEAATAINNSEEVELPLEDDEDDDEEDVLAEADDAELKELEDAEEAEQRDGEQQQLDEEEEEEDVDESEDRSWRR